MDHSYPLLILIVDDTDLERFSVRSRSDVNGHGRVVGLKGSPMVLECVEHVVVGNTPWRPSPWAIVRVGGGT